MYRASEADEGQCLSFPSPLARLVLFTGEEMLRQRLQRSAHYKKQSSSQDVDMHRNTTHLHVPLLYASVTGLLYASVTICISNRDISNRVSYRIFCWRGETIDDR